MDNNITQFVGGPCGQHGPYTFYKAFKYKKNGFTRIVTLSEFFFVKLWMDSDLLCIGELQLLWIDKNSEQVLASLRLYFLPEHTPEGRMDHGEDEVLAIAEKVVLRVEDLVTWITVDAEWTWGRLGNCSKQIKEPPDELSKDDVKPVSLTDSSLDFSDVDKEKKTLSDDDCNQGPSVVILSYPRYCRYRAMMRRLEGFENDYLKYNIVKALGGFSFNVKNTRVMFCRDTFDYPELEGHELLCNHLAPKLKGRPRGKRKKRSVSPGSESNESESSVSTSFNAKSKLLNESSSSGNKNDICNGTLPRRSTRSSDNSDTKEFMKKLTAFMKMKRTPLGRTPSLGFKEIDLHEFYTKVQKLGGYDAVTSNKLWKTLFDDISGHQNNTGAATIMRRHYERFLLAYERHMKGEEYKPLSVTERRRLKTKSVNNRSESESDSGTNTPVSSATTSNAPSPLSATNGDNKDSSVKQEAKTSSLRSVRVKPERQKEKFAKVVKMEDITCGTEALEIIKVEMKHIQEEPSSADVKPETPDIKPETTSVKIENLVKNEPLTSAIAPVAQKIGSPEKTPSPTECKENIPEIRTGDTASSSNDEELQVVNVPCDPKPTETDEKRQNSEDIQIQSEIPEITRSKPIVEEVKRGKLDILKEGGLEVTPVRTFSNPSMTKDIRPSVIQTMPPQVTSKLIGGDLQQMPPPSSIQNVNKRLPINIPQSLNISKVTVANKNSVKSSTGNTASFPFPPTKTQAATTPPKVVQSRSIYSYSEKTVYGNPKDCLVVNSYPVHTPKAPVNLKKQTGGDLLDLTVTSPQKPMVEMRIPNVPNTAHSSYYRGSSSATRNIAKAATLPIFEGRKLGSNLEITLVDSTGRTSVPYQHQNSRVFTPPHPPPQSNNTYKPHNKRTSSGGDSSRGNKIPRIEENGKFDKPSTSQSYGRAGHQSSGSGMTSYPPFGYRPSSSSSKSDNNVNVSGVKSGEVNNVSNNKGFPQGVVFPHYLSQLYEGNKGVSPYFPMIDPVLYSAAMQSLYPQSGMNPAPPFLQFAAQEQLKLYGELMAQQSRLPFPFQLPLQDGELPNNVKKS